MSILYSDDDLEAIPEELEILDWLNYLRDHNLRDGGIVYPDGYAEYVIFNNKGDKYITTRDKDIVDKERPNTFLRVMNKEIRRTDELMPGTKLFGHPTKGRL